MAVDACESLGLKVANFSEETKKKLKKILPAVASLGNPIDLIASADTIRYGKTLEVVLEDKNVDSILVIFVPPITQDPLEVFNLIHQVSQKSTKTVFGCFMGRDEVLRKSDPGEGKIIPIYAFPESAMKTISLMVRYRKWLNRPRGKVSRFKTDRKTVGKVFRAVRASKRVDLTQEEVFRVLEAYGISMSRFKVVTGLEDVIASAGEIGYPVVLKIAERGVSHKTEIGGVVLDIRDDGELVKAFKQLKSNLKRAMGGKNSAEGRFMVQEMIEGGQETILGMNLDPQFGPLLMFGLGGIYVEYIKDVTFRILPLTDVDTDEMIQSIKGYRLLEGVRGKKPSDTKALKKAIGRLAQLVSDFPEIMQLDVNPFIVLPEKKGAIGVDARMSLVE